MIADELDELDELVVEVLEVEDVVVETPPLRSTKISLIVVTKLPSGFDRAFPASQSITPPNMASLKKRLRTILAS